ncbi:plasmid mobilization relaxosome protein MobC [Mucilaginibacter sp. PAMB04168]|uniref:plasmid mobilization protein n=1 Tax=Mucilaginibacter sp. PAMB04168 TaxID=3138567 RepID=UPI0031F61FA4
MADQRKLAERPKLEREKRTRKIDARFTQTEYDLVLTMERTLGVSKTELVRVRLLNGSERMLLNTRELISQMDALGAEMARVGNNINQLARHANIMKLQGQVPYYVAEKFNQLFEQYLDLQQRLEIVFRKVIRLAGR